MKKLYSMLLLLVVACIAHAQTDSLQQYVGKYKFPEGSIVSEVTVVLENGSLVMNSSAGNSALTKEEGEDAFTIVAFQGLAKFKRDANKKVNGVTINAMGYYLEGSKEMLVLTVLPVQFNLPKKFALVK